MGFISSKRKLEFKIDGEIIREDPALFSSDLRSRKLCSKTLKKDEMELLLVNLAESEKRRRPRRLKVVDFFWFSKNKRKLIPELIDRGRF